MVSKLFGRFEFITDLQYKVKHFQHEVDAFKSGDKYVKMNLDFQAKLAERNRKIKKLQNELTDSRREIVTVRSNWMQVFEDLQVEHAKAIHNKECLNKALEERALKAERLVDELKDENLVLKRECYAVKIEIEEESAKNQKLTAQINRDYENSSNPSSLKPNHKKIMNNREKTGRKPGGQPGHEGHGRKRQAPTSMVEIPAPEEYLNNPEYEITNIEKRRQLVGIKLLLNSVEYYTVVFRHKETGKLAHADFPVGVDNDVNYDSSIKAFAFLLNNHCNVSIDKVRQFLCDLTGGALEISKGMINGLSREFAAKSIAEQKKVFLDLVGAPVLNEDFTTARVNGKNVNIFICATPREAAYYATEHKAACLLFLRDKTVPADNNLSERLGRVFKRKLKQVMTFRSFDSLVYLCQCLTVMATLRTQKDNFYQCIANVFG